MRRSGTPSRHGRRAGPSSAKRRARPTTGTTSSTTTDLKPCGPVRRRSRPRAPTTDPTSPDGLSSLWELDAMFAAAVLNSRRPNAASGSAGRTPPTSRPREVAEPAFEPVVVARKPIQRTVAANVLGVGAGALNIDACRVARDGSNPGWSKTGSKPARHQHEMGQWIYARPPAEARTARRVAGPQERRARRVAGRGARQISERESRDVRRSAPTRRAQSSARGSYMTADHRARAYGGLRAARPRSSTSPRPTPASDHGSRSQVFAFETTSRPSKLDHVRARPGRGRCAEVD